MLYIVSYLFKKNKTKISNGIDKKFIILVIKFSSYKDQDIDIEMADRKLCKTFKTEDGKYYSNKRQHPFSYHNFPPKEHKSKQRDTSPSFLYNIQSTKNKGIMREAIAARLQEYKNDHRKKFVRKTFQQVQYQTKKRKMNEMRESPLISKSSKKIFEKVSQQKNLSPQILVRFQQYERSKTLQKLKNKLYSYMKEKKRIPKPQQIVSPEKIGQMEGAKKLIQTFTSMIKPYVDQHQKSQEFKENQQLMNDMKQSK